MLLALMIVNKHLSKSTDVPAICEPVYAVAVATSNDHQQVQGGPKNGPFLRVYDSIER